MSTPEYPSNRIGDPGSPAASRFKDNEQETPPVDKDIKRVTSEEPKRRRRSLRKQFKAVFFNGDPKATAEYVAFGVLLPAAQDMVLDAISGGAERIIKGETRRRRTTSAPPSGPSGFVSYNRYSMGGQRAQEPPRYVSHRARASHNFDEIVLTSRAEAEEVIERMYDIIGRYDSVTVADFYELVGTPSAHTDHKWGWVDLRGAGVARVRNGYLIDLPTPEVLG